MTGSAQKFFDRVYAHAHGPDVLPWHRDAPPALLTRVVAERTRAGSSGRALDIGCGSGVFSVWLAPGGAYVLGHFDRRHPLDWRPVEPRRVPPARIHALFLPPLVERARDAETHRAEFPIGPTVRVALYWFEKEPMNTGHGGAERGQISGLTPTG